MSKDFDEWGKKKPLINEVAIVPFFHEREVWSCILGANIGFEQDGAGEDFLRPVLVIRKFNQQVMLAIPLTRTRKDGKHYFSFKFRDEISTAILSQIRLIDSKRLSYLLGTLPEEQFTELKEKLRILMRL